MADIELKYKDNIEGRYFVDEECIDCDLCRETAPACFTRNEDIGYSYVFKQPENEEQEGLCKEDYWYRGKYEDSACYALLKKEWQANR